MKLGVTGWRRAPPPHEAKARVTLRHFAVVRADAGRRGPASSMHGQQQPMHAACTRTRAFTLRARGLRTEATDMSQHIGRTTWVIAEGYIPPESRGPPPEMTSHETACVLNASDRDAHVRISVYFSDREPVGPYRVTVPARRTLHLRFNDLTDPTPIPRGTDYASVVRSDVPIVVQHTRLDSRQAAEALLTTLAYAE